MYDTCMINTLKSRTRVILMTHLISKPLKTGPVWISCSVGIDFTVITKELMRTDASPTILSPSIQTHDISTLISLIIRHTTTVILSILTSQTLPLITILLTLVPKERRRTYTLAAGCSDPAVLAWRDPSTMFVQQFVVIRTFTLDFGSIIVHKVLHI